MPNRMVQVTISLDEQVIADIDRAADAMGRSRAWIIRQEVLRALPALKKATQAATS